MTDDLQHGRARLIANDRRSIGTGSPAAWDKLVDAIVSDTLKTPFQRDTRAHWEVAGPTLRDRDYRVVIPVSGGMDSATLVRQAQECSTPADLVFFDLGQPYAAHEMQSLDDRRIMFDVHTERRSWIDHGGIMVGRNSLIVLRCAQRLVERGFWGEVWIGAVAGENDARGGDKSPRWLNDVNAMLARAGVDVRVVAPLHALDKSDQVALAVAQGWEHELAATKSCHRGDVWACGACKTCFRKWIAFAEHGQGDLLLEHHAAPEGIAAFEPFVDDYERWISRPGSKYGLRRRESTRNAIARVRAAASVR